MFITRHSPGQDTLTLCWRLSHGGYMVYHTTSGKTQQISVSSERKISMLSAVTDHGPETSLHFLLLEPLLIHRQGNPLRPREGGQCMEEECEPCRSPARAL